LQGETALDAKLEENDKKILMDKAHSAIILSLGHNVIRQVSKEKTTTGRFIHDQISGKSSLS